YYFGKTDPFGYHLVNFAVHFLTACFLFLLIIKTLNLPLLRDAYSRHAYSIALLVVVFWAIHPLQVTAVTYIVQRMASMAGLFYVMCMYFYVLGRTSGIRKRRPAFFAAAVLCALLGLASKQNAAMLPVSIFLYDLFLIQGVSRQSLKKNLAVAAVPLGAVILLGAVYTDFSSLLGGYENRPFTLGQRLLTQPRVLLFYVSQLLYPVDSRLTLIHGVHVSTGLFTPVTTVLSIASIVGAVCFALVKSKKYPLLCFSILFFLVNHAIEGTVVPLELIYEHRNYVPSFFFFVPIAVFIVAAIKYFSYQRTLQAAIALVIVIVWIGQGHTVYMRNQRFSDPVSLWSDNAEKAPGLSRVHTNLGNAYFDNNAYDMAYESYMRAKKADYYHNIFNKGTLYYNLSRYYFHVEGDFEKTLYHTQIARSLYPGKWHVWYYSILGELSNGRLLQARDLANAACEQWPEKEPLQYVKGLILLKQKEYNECIKAARDALTRDIESGRFYKLMGVAYLYIGKLESAARFLDIAKEKLSGDKDLMLARVDTYHRMGDREAMEKAVQELLCEKRESTWEEYLRGEAEESALNAYEIQVSKFIPIIRNGMSRITP
ncbi:MAG: tetratricopeptide repeat protein, partial [Desulfosalsimonas sp.]